MNDEWRGFIIYPSSFIIPEKLMPVPGWPDWLSHAWYRVNHAVQMVGMTLSFSFRHEGMGNVPPTGPVLLLANHQSYLDPSIVGVAAGRDIHYLARKTLFKNRLLALYIRSMNGVPVDHTGVAKEGLKAVIDLLQAGQAVVVFPEGERTHTGEMQPLKPGIHLVLKKAPAPVVPIGIAGAYQAFPRTRKLPLPSPLFWPATGGAVAAAVGKALDPDWLLKLPREDFLQTLLVAMQTVQRRAERIKRKP
ncbi:MAG TPA: lysophospholipid acyltransferase family protein [Gemmataceae bacterium]|nr:lysophospholipid acyltransferase family protein [Gemmataceae bacterium]